MGSSHLTNLMKVSINICYYMGWLLASKAKFRLVNKYDP